MKVLVIGGNGSIGRRYCAILRSLRVDYDVYDTISMNDLTHAYDKQFDKAIIASPTDTHYHYCKELIKIGKPFLCEKPLSKSLDECRELVELDEYRLGYVVNNWSHIERISKPDFHIISITYNYYNTGKDGLFWDCCQAINLDPFCLLGNSSPIWYLTINGNKVDYLDMELSYNRMIMDFVFNTKLLLANLDVGLSMTKAVLERIERENSNRNSK